MIYWNNIFHYINQKNIHVNLNYLNLDINYYHIMNKLTNLANFSTKSLWLKTFKFYMSQFSIITKSVIHFDNDNIKINTTIK